MYCDIKEQYLRKYSRALVDTALSQLTDNVIPAITPTAQAKIHGIANAAPMVPAYTS